MTRPAVCPTPRGMKGRLLLLAIAAMSVWLIASTSSGATAPVPVGITEGEYYIHLSGRLSAPHGKVQFNIWNRGEDDHNFYIGRNQHQYALLGRIPSGGHATLATCLRQSPVLSVVGYLSSSLPACAASLHDGGR